MFEVYIILTLSANLISGYTGLLSFANAAFYGVGAFATSILLTKYEMNHILVLVISMLAAGLVSIPLAYFSIKLKDLYYVIASIAFQIIIFTICYNWELTGASFGISGISKPSILGLEINHTSDFVLYGGILLFLVLLFFLFLKRIPYTRRLEAIRDNPLASESFGVNINKFKYTVHILSAMLMAISGYLFATYNSYVDATSFTLDESILIVSMLLIGGTGNLKGPIFGACFFVLLPEVMRLIPISSSQGASLQMIIYGLILVLIVRHKPNGILGKFRFH